VFSLGLLSEAKHMLPCGGWPESGETPAQPLSSKRTNSFEGMFFSFCQSQELEVMSRAAKVRRAAGKCVIEWRRAESGRAYDIIETRPGW